MIKRLRETKSIAIYEAVLFKRLLLLWTRLNQLAACLVGGHVSWSSYILYILICDLVRFVIHFADEQFTN